MTRLSLSAVLLSTALLFAGAGVATTVFSQDAVAKTSRPAKKKVAKKHYPKLNKRAAKASAVTTTSQKAVATVAPLKKYTAEQCDAAFFAKTGADAAYKTTPSGLKYYVVKEGNGKQPKATDDVTVHYTGRLLDGTVFDSSVARGEPLTFPLDRVIAGWTEGVQLMKEGEKAVFYIPSDLAYGKRGTPGGPIPPDAPLIFEIELIKVN